jgi:hypothetical protein
MLLLLFLVVIMMTFLQLCFASCSGCPCYVAVRHLVCAWKLKVVRVYQGQDPEPSNSYCSSLYS